jgi:GNAT superfamily N-acetyltransferase
MQAVNDLCHYSTLVKESKSHGKSVVTNCYLLPAEINKYIQQHRMFWKQFNQGIIFLCEELDFYYLYFYLTQETHEQAPLQFERENKPVVIDLVYLESNKPLSLSEVENQWLASGFSTYKLYRRMVLDLSSEQPASIKKNILNSDLYELSHATPGDYNDVLTLWRSSLDVFSTALPDKDELIGTLDNKQVYAVYGKNKKIVAALQFKRNGKIGFVDHVVVDDKHRNQGLANVLLQAALSENKDISKCCLWVDENNHPARKFYLKNGFYFDGRISCQLLLKS